jgi:uncharacterized protein (TIGR02611 family)
MPIRQKFGSLASASLIFSDLMWIETLRQARRIIVAGVGFTVLFLGIVMIVAPGPGWLVILLGLSILSAEFVWPRRWLRRIKKTGTDLARTVLGESKVVPGQKA